VSRADSPDSPLQRRVAELVSDGVAEASRPAVAFAGLVVTLGALISLLVPNIPPDADPSEQQAAAAPPSDADDELATT
jgi:hypothetical protein